MSNTSIFPKSRSAVFSEFDRIRKTPVDGEHYTAYIRQHDSTRKTDFGLDVVGREAPLSINSSQGIKDLAQYCVDCGVVLFTDQEKWQTLKEPRRDPRTFYTDHPLNQQQLAELRSSYIASMNK